MATAYLDVKLRTQVINEEIWWQRRRCWLKRVRCSALSDMYETEPWGFGIGTTLSWTPWSLWRRNFPYGIIRRYPFDRDRDGTYRKSDCAYHDRIIDIDLLMVDEQILHTERSWRRTSDAQTVVCNGTVGRNGSVGETSCVWQDDAWTFIRIISFNYELRDLSYE